MLSSLDYGFGFDPFNQLKVLLYAVVLFVLCILANKLLQILILIFIMQEHDNNNNDNNNNNNNNNNNSNNGNN